MSTTYTEHYSFGKQENYADLFSMEVITDNWDSLDTILYNFSKNKQDKLSTTNKLNVDYVDFTAAQLSAINSGITAERLETDENNILFNTNMGVKNLCKLNVSADSEVSYTVNADLSITVTCNTTALREVRIFTDLSGLVDGQSYILSGCDGGAYSSTYGFAVRTSGGTGKAFESDGETTFIKSSDMAKMDLIIRSGQNWTKTFYPMIRPASISDSTYQPYAPSNRELYEEVGVLENIKRRVVFYISPTPVNNIYFGYVPFPVVYDTAPSVSVDFDTASFGNQPVSAADFTVNAYAFGVRIYTTNSAYAGLFIPALIK